MNPVKDVWAAQISESQFVWDLEFLNGNGCKSLIENLYEVIFTDHFSSSFWIIGWLAWEHGTNQQKTRCQLTRTENALRWQNVPVQISLIQVQLWFKFLLESPAIATTCRATTNRRSWKVSNFKLNLFNFRRFVEVEIQLSRPIRTYVLAQCLNNLWLAFQVKLRCRTCLKYKTQLWA